METQQIRKQFAKRMVILAKLTNFQMEEEILGLYWRYMNDLEPNIILEALESAITDVGSKSVFPSAKKIRSYVDAKLDIEDRADLLSRLILKSISKYGYVWPWGTNWPDCAIKELGIDAWAVVETMGGWSNLNEQCRVTESSHFYAQMKKTAIATLRKLDKEERGKNRIPIGDGRSSGDNLSERIPGRRGLEQPHDVSELPVPTRTERS